MSARLSERGMMTVRREGKEVELIPFVGVKPRAMASALSRLIGDSVTYRPHEESGHVA